MKRSHLSLAVLGIIASAAVIAAAILLDHQLPTGVNGVMCGLGGALLGVSVTAVLMELWDRRRTPEERREQEVGEQDERNIAIREKAASSSWYWSLIMLWIPFVAALVIHQMLFILLSAGAIVLHCVFYMVNISRWNKIL